MYWQINNIDSTYVPILMFFVQLHFCSYTFFIFIKFYKDQYNTNLSLLDIRSTISFKSAIMESCFYNANMRDLLVVDEMVCLGY